MILPVRVSLACRQHSCSQQDQHHTVIEAFFCRQHGLSQMWCTANTGEAKDRKTCRAGSHYHAWLHAHRRHLHTVQTGPCFLQGQEAALSHASSLGLTLTKDQAASLSSCKHHGWNHTQIHSNSLTRTHWQMITSSHDSLTLVGICLSHAQLHALA